MRSTRSLSDTGPLLESIDLQFPPLAVLAVDQRVGFGAVGGAELVGVPGDLLADAIGHVPQVIGLGEPARILEVGARRLARLAGPQPLLVMAGRTGNARLGPLVI